MKQETREGMIVIGLIIAVLIFLALAIRQAFVGEWDLVITVPVWRCVAIAMGIGILALIREIGFFRG